jgi:hypothetical protein
MKEQAERLTENQGRVSFERLVNSLRLRLADTCWPRIRTRTFEYMQVLLPKIEPGLLLPVD